MNLADTFPSPPEHCFWLIATKPCGRCFRLKIKRHWLFQMTLQHWPVKVNAPAISMEECNHAFDQIPPEFWNKLPHAAQVKIHRWLHHFTTRHTGVMIHCIGTLDLHPEWTRAIQRQNARQDLALLLPALRAALNIDPTDLSPILVTGRDWCDALESHLAHKYPRFLLKPKPTYTPQQIAEGKQIIAAMRSGGWLKTTSRPVSPATAENTPHAAGPQPSLPDPPACGPVRHAEPLHR